jgi:hypothetical protein
MVDDLFIFFSSSPSHLVKCLSLSKKKKKIKKKLINGYGINTTGSALLRTSVLFPHASNFSLTSLNRAVTQ